MCNYVYKSEDRKDDNCQYREKYPGIPIFSHDGKNYCLFHAPISERKNNHFWSYFEKIANKNLFIRETETTEYFDFEGFIFPDIPKDKMDLIFQEDITINLMYSEFTGKLYLSGSENERKTIKNKIYFTGAKYHNSCLFEYIDFEKDVYFSDALFMKAVSFNYSSFLQKCIFSFKTRFKGWASFFKANFNNVDFMGSYFYDSVCFNNTEFGKENSTTGFGINFIGVRFLSRINEVDFSNAEFYSKAIFTGLRTRSAIKFIDTKFHDDVDFSGAWFGNSVNFHKAIFKGQASFYNGPVFKNDAHFENAIFEKRADFTNAKFLHKAFFNWATFEGEVYFSDAKFNYIEFNSSCFYESVSFKNAHFGEMDFIGAVFKVRPLMVNIHAFKKKLLIKNLVSEVELIFDDGKKSIQKKGSGGSNVK